MISGFNEVLKKSPDEPLSLAAGDNKREILTQLNRIKFQIKGRKLGYYPINASSS